MEFKKLKNDKVKMEYNIKRRKTLAYIQPLYNRTTEKKWKNIK